MEWIKNHKIFIIIIAVCLIVIIALIAWGFYYLGFRANANLSANRQTTRFTIEREGYNVDVTAGFPSLTDHASTFTQLPSSIEKAKSSDSEIHLFKNLKEKSNEIQSISKDYVAVKSMNETLCKNLDIYVKSFDLAQEKIKSLSNDLATANTKNFSLTHKLKEAETSLDNYVPLWQYLAIVSEQSRDIERFSNEVVNLKQEYDETLRILFYSVDDDGLQDYYRNAEKLLKEKSETYSEAQNKLGYMYDPYVKANFKGIKKDKKKAEEYYLKASNSGHPYSQVHLAHFYFLEKKYDKAKIWYEKASVNSDKEVRDVAVEMLKNPKLR